MVLFIFYSYKSLRIDQLYKIIHLLDLQFMFKITKTSTY